MGERKRELYWKEEKGGCNGGGEGGVLVNFVVVKVEVVERERCECQREEELKGSEGEKEIELVSGNVE